MANEYQVYARGNATFPDKSPMEKPSPFALALRSRVKLR